MIQSLTRGWTFIKQSWAFGLRSPAVFLPTLIGLLAAILTMIVMLLPVAGLIYYIHTNEWGQVTIGIVVGLLLIVLVAIINVISIMTSNQIGSVLAGRLPVTADAWRKVSDLGGDLYVMGLGLPIQRLWFALKSLFTRKVLRSEWERNDHLYLPVLANEEISFQGTPKRILELQADNSVFSAQGVGIRKLVFILIVGALVIGLAAGLGGAWLVLNGGQDASQARALAFGLAALLVAIFALPVVLFSAYTLTLFNTCLYQWGKAVQSARGKGASGSATVPEPLAIALGIRQGR